MPPRVIAIVGATATGKTALGIAVAQQLGGEVVNADSRQVYRGMDIGTAKPTLDDQASVPHHLLDVADPDQTMTLATYIDLAAAAISAITDRGRTPIIVGGTGQYVWALLEGWQVPRVPPDRELRAHLEARAEHEGAQVLADELRRIDPASAQIIDVRNVRRMIRAIEVTQATGRPFSEWQLRDPPALDARIIGLRLDRAALYERIDGRVDAMLAGGLIGEVRSLLAAGFGCDLPAMSGIGYRQVCDHLAGRCTLGEATQRIKTETHRLARMQHAWFKPSDPRIEWFDASSESLAAAVLETLSVPRNPALS
jgi:tRNA dimethylallyltransferase